MDISVVFQMYKNWCWISEIPVLCTKYMFDSTCVLIRNELLRKCIYGSLSYAISMVIIVTFLILENEKFTLYFLSQFLIEYTTFCVFIWHNHMKLHNFVVLHHNWMISFAIFSVMFSEAWQEKESNIVDSLLNCVRMKIVHNWFGNCTKILNILYPIVFDDSIKIM